MHHIASGHRTVVAVVAQVAEGGAIDRTRMRFKATNENLILRVSPDEMPQCIRRVVRFLVPRHTPKVYLLAEPEPPFSTNQFGLAVVGAQDLPSNFLQSFRIILRPGELVLVSGQRRFTHDQWRDLAAHLEVHAA